MSACSSVKASTRKMTTSPPKWPRPLAFDANHHTLQDRAPEMEPFPYVDTPLSRSAGVSPALKCAQDARGRETGMTKLAFKRVLLKVSGQALMGERDYGIDLETLSRIASEVAECLKAGAQMSLVIGGGNIFRGMEGAAKGM